MEAPPTNTLAIEPAPSAPPTPDGRPSRAAARAQELARTQVNAQKDKLVQAFDSVAVVMQQGSQSLQQQGQPQLGEYARAGGQKVQELSNYLRQTDGSELIQKARDAARQQPAVVVGGGFVVALIASRLLKSLQSEPEAQETQVAAEQPSSSVEEPQPEQPAAPEEPPKRGSRRRSTAPAEIAPTE